MPDRAHQMTDAELRKLEKRIAKIYKEASDELSGIIREYFESFRGRDEAMKKMVDDGTITDEYYKQWRLNQIGRGKRFEELRDKIAERMTQAYELAVAYANGDMAKIYALNRNFTISDVQRQAGEILEGIDFIAFDEETVKRLIVEQPNLMPNYPAEKAVKRGIDLAFGKRQITASITSSILQGKSVGKIADDLQRRIPDMARTSAIRTARTAITSAENAGRQDAADDLEKIGVILKKEWIATHDSSTRHSHARADGQIVDNDQPFIVGGEKLMFPGDSSMGASGWNIYNCRCTKGTIVKGFRSTLTDSKKKKANIRRVK